MNTTTAVHEAQPTQINGLYDDRMYHPLFLEFYGGKDYANYGYWEGSPKNGGEASENLVLKLMSMIPEHCQTVLDVACGKGASTTCLQKRFAAADVSAINISEKQLATARKKNPGVDFHMMSAVEMEFDDHSFDAVMCVEAAFHFNTRERFLAEALRVLKPGGALVLSDTLMPRHAEAERRFRHEANYLEDIAEYGVLLERLGYTDHTVTDVTELTWKPMFRAIVTFMHERYLTKQAPRELVDLIMDTNLRMADDLEVYLLASARKPH